MVKATNFYKTLQIQSICIKGYFIWLCSCIFNFGVTSLHLVSELTSHPFVYIRDHNKEGQIAFRSPFFKWTSMNLHNPPTFPLLSCC